MRKKYCTPTLHQIEVVCNKVIVRSVNNVELQTTDKSRMFFEYDDSSLQQSDSLQNRTGSMIWDDE